ncbi:type IV pilus biogenesis protein PilN family protein [Bacteroides pyogenes F0041]|uniref:Type IV pilus biogenesis protein PilN family protein n=1 Tax=Bacteroides pyogenes F0041 TaxID=1321819 RepID=U2CX60_9BACE|nr:DUF2892 domain-containing protein [Bacteroides pyogenes]ERI89145.1 type IV pilus biogenesis protein PilN family protein [Bacteroides pyogenes F0041]MBB3894656.1 hypothetical protein [Bacteroides pyogenes]GAE20994.1 rhodanese-related sulfurtransferase [Bacteroides pyogenes JCM 10003]SUV34955.1 Protein of uncharacterised function (DUF2892) [Bacteroides pyogenes]
MKKEYIIRLVVGSMVLAGTSLAYFVSSAWLLLPLFVGANLVQSSFTGFCPLEYFLDKSGVK